MVVPCPRPGPASIGCGPFWPVEAYPASPFDRRPAAGEFWVIHSPLASPLGFPGLLRRFNANAYMTLLDLYRVSGQIADVLSVRVNWLLGRSKVMDVMEMPELPQAGPPRTE